MAAGVGPPPRPALPPRLAEVLARALHKQPEFRYQDGDALAQDLRAVLAQPASNAFHAAAPAAVAPGYDAAQNDGLAPGLAFEKTTVMNASGAPEKPPAGSGEPGQEP